MLIERIYHPYSLWEEADTNMWGSVADKDAFLKVAIEFTGNHVLYGKHMEKVVSEWKYSCEHNLSNATQNRKAWIGHAACAYAFNCPEDIVRKAWSFLTDEQRILANEQADKAIKKWEAIYLCQK
jgi:hypothetical protein